jgi:7-carboxy-7-deazaguanine synthase
MKVNEIFYSLQGEGSLAGIPTVFIRLQGCNLNCAWCDTPYAHDTQEGKVMTVNEIADEVALISPTTCSWICITGGEPLEQAEELEELVATLRLRDYFIEIETNGSKPPPPWHIEVDNWCVDIKGPSSGEMLSWNAEWEQLPFVGSFKLVAANREDLTYLAALAPRLVHADPNSIMVSPCNSANALASEDWMQECADFCKHYGYHLSLQLHKVIWGNKRGV